MVEFMQMKKQKLEQEVKFSEIQENEVLDLCPVSPGDVRPSIPESKGLSEMPRITVDSGAAHSVINPADLPGATLEPSEGSRRGLKYQGPGSELIPNLGQLCVTLMTLGGALGKTTWQAANVRKPLMAVSGINDKGNLVVFDNAGSAIVPGDAPEAAEIRRLLQRCQNRVDLERSGGVFTMRAWRAGDEAASVFARPGR